MSTINRLGSTPHPELRPTPISRRSATPGTAGPSAPVTSFRQVFRTQSFPLTSGMALPKPILTSTLPTTTSSTPATTTTPATPTTTTPTTPTVPAATDPTPRFIGSVSPLAPPTTTAPAAPPTSPLAPTAQSLFGDSPWETDAGGTGLGTTYSYNHYYFATPQTAAIVAKMLGGQVVEQSALTPGGPFAQNEPNQMIKMPDGRMINAGLVAGFYDHGYTQTQVNQMIAAEVSGNTMVP